MTEFRAVRRSGSARIETRLAGARTGRISRRAVGLGVPKEEWKPVVGFEGLYIVSSLGNVEAVERRIINHNKDGKSYTQIRKSQRLKSHDDGHGYMHIRLVKDNRVYNTKVHRLVAKAFIDNPLSLPEVNHKNGNKQDNRVENLEWVSRSTNCMHAAYVLENTKPKPRKVVCVESGVVYKSCMDAQRKTGVNNSAISDAARGKERSDKNGYKYKRQTAGGFHWRYL